MIPMDDTALELGSLWDGDTFEHRGITYTIHAEPDDIAVRDLWTKDCYGQLSEYCYDYHHDSREPRPAGMDGRAEKIQHDRGYWSWWQAPDDVPRGTEQYRKLRALVRDILELGWSYVTLESDDGYSAAIGGVEPDQGNAGLAFWADELFAEIQHQRERDHVRRLVRGANRCFGTRLVVPTN